PQPIRMRPMWAADGRAPQSHAVSFVSGSSLEEGLRKRLGGERRLVAVEHCRKIGKADMRHNAATPHIEVDPRTYEVRADGLLLTCEPAEVLPLAQRYALF
ncbi:MAG TPA: urease subunit alpha, partial [Candidatus Acidoferrales bacterium]|nr:urease subunit alpha [Candidatus Acidoferrales bacterium]